VKDTVTTVREHTLRVRVTLDQAAAERVARCYQNGRPTHCVVQAANGTYLPAVLTRDVPSEAAPACLLIVYLAPGEADVLFPTGYRFIIWADVLVGQTVQAKGMLGHGTIHENAPSPGQPAGSPPSGLFALVEQHRERREDRGQRRSRGHCPEHLGRGGGAGHGAEQQRGAVFADAPADAIATLLGALGDGLLLHARLDPGLDVHAALNALRAMLAPRPS